MDQGKQGGQRRLPHGPISTGVGRLATVFGEPPYQVNDPVWHFSHGTARRWLTPWKITTKTPRQVKIRIECIGKFSIYSPPSDSREWCNRSYGLMGSAG
jgi:hypothetical protein